MKMSWLDGSKAALVPILAVGVLAVVYFLFQSLFIKCDHGYAKCKPFNENYIFSPADNYPINDSDKVIGKDKERADNLKLIAHRYGRRLVWVFLIAVSVLVSIASLITAAYLIRKSGSFRKELPSVRLLLSIGFSLLLGFVLGLDPDNYMPVMRPILASTIADARLGVPVVFGTMNIINSLTYVAASAIVISSCAILLPRTTAIANAENNNAPDKTADASGDMSVETANNLNTLSEQVRDLRVVLYVGTLLLIIGILRMTAVTQWSLSFISPDAVEAAQSFYISLSSVTGGLYSLILAAVYLPAAFILQHRAKILTEGLPADKQQETLKSKGFTFSFRESMPRIVAVLGPLLAGPIGELFTSVNKAGL